MKKPFPLQCGLGSPSSVVYVNETAVTHIRGLHGASEGQDKVGFCPKNDCKACISFSSGTHRRGTQIIIVTKSERDFPSGPVVKTWQLHASSVGETGLSPSRRTKIPHKVGHGQYICVCVNQKTNGREFCRGFLESQGLPGI